MDNDSVKDNIRKARREKRLTQKECAEKIGISRTAYRNLEQGETKVLCEYLPKLAEITGRSQEELILGYKPKNKSLRLEEQDNHKEQVRSITEFYEDKLKGREEMIDVLKVNNKALRETLDIFIARLS